MNYYQKLEISSDATAQQIKEAYRRLAFEYHPDRNAGNEQAADKMKAINEAYAVLSNPEQRRRYDALFHTYGERAGERFRQTYTEQDIFKGSDIQQIFEEMARSFGLRGFDEIFKDFYKQGYRGFEFRQPGMFGKGVFFKGPFPRNQSGQKPPGLTGNLARSVMNKLFGLVLPQRGRDLHDIIKVLPQLAETGGPFAYFHRSKGKRLVVHIPSGIGDGQIIRLAGMGKDGTHGAPAGDLLLKVRIKTPLLSKLKNIIH